MTETLTRLQGLDLAGMHALADKLVNELPPHVVIGLVGTLGAGKTSLVQAIAGAAGIDSVNVTSPTFTLLQTHRGKLKLHHLDAYRLADEDEFLELGVDELMEEPDAWTLVEWADRVADVMPPTTLWIEITIDPDDTRRSVQFKCNDPAIGKILQSKLGHHP